MNFAFFNELGGVTEHPGYIKLIKETARMDDEQSAIEFNLDKPSEATTPFNAQKAVEGISQKKASGDQWLAMIQKAGGLKAGEDKWLGLSDWLNERKGKPVSLTPPSTRTGTNWP